MGLREQGFRFVLQDGAFRWTHPGDVRQGAVDCTEMVDEEFANMVEKNLDSRLIAHYYNSINKRNGAAK